MNVKSKASKIIQSFLLSIYLQLFICDIIFFFLNFEKLIKNFKENYLINLFLPITILIILSIIISIGFFALFKNKYNKKNIIYLIFYKWTEYIKLDKLLEVKVFSFISLFIYEIVISSLMIFSSFFWIIIGIFTLSENISLGIIFLVLGSLILIDLIIWIFFKCLDFLILQKNNSYKNYEKYILIFSLGFGWAISIYQFQLINEKNKIAEKQKSN